MRPSVAVIGAGPAGLMAAEVLGAGGVAVTVYDRMPSAGRKFLMAGRGGLNLTHSEAFEAFVTRYGAGAAHLRPMLEAFPPAALAAWANGLGQETFVGSSGRVFPKAMKASPLLRAWLARLREQGVQFAMRRTWRGWDEQGALEFRAPDGIERLRPDATVLALGGASWPRLGSDGHWMDILSSKGVVAAPLRPANGGFTVAWSLGFRQRFAGEPIKNVALTFNGRRTRGDAMATNYGLEGGAVYALSAVLRDAIGANGNAVLHVDLRPDMPIEQLIRKLDRPRGKETLSNFLRKAAKLSPLEINLLREAGTIPADAAALAARIKAVPIVLTATQGIARAISTAGGIAFSALDGDLMLRTLPDVYAAGEMLDWEAPTGGYLLQACFATGAFAAKAILHKIGS